MLEEFLKFGLINPLSFPLLDNVESLMLEYEYDDYKDEIDDLLDDLVEGQSLQQPLLAIYDNALDNVLSSFGIHIDNQMRYKIDVLESLQVLSTIDKDLGDELINNCDGITNVEMFEYLVSDYLKTDFSLFDLNGVTITATCTDTIKSIIKNDSLDNDDLVRASRYGRMRENVLKVYDYKDIDIMLTNLTDLTLTNDDKLQFITNVTGSLITRLHKLATIYLFMDDITPDSYLLLVNDRIDESIVEQISNALLVEIQRISK